MATQNTRGDDEIKGRRCRSSNSGGDVAAVTPFRRGRRLARAVWLDVRGMGPGRYQVTGGAESHIVQKELEGWSCDCADSVFGGAFITQLRIWYKHLLLTKSP